MRTIALRTAEGRWIAHEVRIACSLRSRMLGLSRERSLPTRGGLLLSPARGGVHTLGMRFAIDVVFLSGQMRVLGLAARVQPWRILLAPRGTGRVLELAAGQIAVTGLKTGAFIVVESGPDGEPPARPCNTRANCAPSRLNCERLPIQFSLRLPLQRSCANRPVTTASGRGRFAGS